MPNYTKYFAIGVAGDLLADLIVTKEAREVKIITEINEYEAYILDLDRHFEGKLRDLNSFSRLFPFIYVMNGNQLKRRTMQDVKDYIQFILSEVSIQGLIVEIMNND